MRKLKSGSDKLEMYEKKRNTRKNTQLEERNKQEKMRTEGKKPTIKTKQEITTNEI